VKSERENREWTRMDANKKTKPQMDQPSREAMAGKLQIYADLVAGSDHSDGRWETSLAATVPLALWLGIETCRVACVYLRFRLFVRVHSCPFAVFVLPRGFLLRLFPVCLPDLLFREALYR
jgi:hypothetical protein